MAKDWLGRDRKPVKHHTWVHHDVIKTDPRPKQLPLIVECVMCTWTANGFTRRPDAKAAGLEHEMEANHG